MSEERAGLDARGPARERLVLALRRDMISESRCENLLDAIEAEAVAAERVRLAEAVRALPAYEEHDETLGMDIYDPMGVYRAAVLALLEPKP